MSNRIAQAPSGSGSTPSEPKIEFILIYGVRGDDQDTFPVQKWVSAFQDLPVSGIHIAAHDLDFTVDVDKTSEHWRRRSSDLLLYLFDEIKQASYSSLALCCYGLAGILLKQAFSRADEQHKKYSDLFRGIIGVIFICTPHVSDSTKFTKHTLLHVLRPGLKPRKLRRQYKHLDISVFTDVTVAFSTRSYKRIPIFSLYPTSQADSPKRRLVRFWKRKEPTETFNSEHFSLMETDEQMLGIDAGVLTKPDIYGNIAATQLLPFINNLSVLAGNRATGGHHSHVTELSHRNGLFTDATSEAGRDDLTGQVDPNAAQMRQVTQDGQLIPTDAQIGNNDMALRLPYHCLDDFHNTDFWISLSGRQDVFKSIDKAFFPPEPSEPIGDDYHSFCSPLKVFTLHGLEGIGKSRVAAEYVNRRKDKFPVILWIDAASEDKMYSVYRTFASELGLSNEPDRPEPDPVIKNVVQKWLSNPVDRGSMVPWLIVMDSVDRDVLSDFWPHNGQGSLLLTTRKPALARMFGTSEASLEPLSVEEGAEMLLNLTKQRNEPNAGLHAKQIAKFWEGIPGCMELANGVIRSKQLSLAEFAATQQAKKDDYLLGKGLYGVKKPTEAFSVMSWLTIEALETHNEGELELLVVLSFLDGSRVQERILTTHPSVAVLDKFPTKYDVYLECRKRLWEASAIKHDTITKEIRLLNTVQDTLLLRMKEQGKQLSSGLVTAAALVLSLWPRAITAETSFSDLKMGERWYECGYLMPHVNRMKGVYLEMTEADKRVCATREFIQLLAEAAWFQSEKANATACQTLVDLGLLIHDSADPSEQDSMLDIYAALHNTKGGVLRRVNKPQEALQHMKHFLDAQHRLCSASGGVPSSKLAAAYSELALAHLACGDTKEVLTLLGESTTIRRGLPTFTPIELYNPLRYEGLYHMHQQDWTNAERCFLKAMRDRQERYGLDDDRTPRAGVILYNLGDLYRLQGKWQESYQYHQRAHQSLKRAVGETHLTTLRAEYKIARDLIESKDAKCLPQAKERLKHCLEAHESQLFVEGETARARFSLGKVLQMIGDPSAESYLKQAMQDRQRLVEETDDRALEVLTIADFDAVVPFGAQ